MTISSSKLSSSKTHAQNCQVKLANAGNAKEKKEEKWNSVYLQAARAAIQLETWVSKVEFGFHWWSFNARFHFIHFVFMWVNKILVIHVMSMYYPIVLLLY